MTTTENFYDLLSQDYDRLFRDWDAAVAWQGELLAGLLGAWHPGSIGSVLDCSCGIGTQSIGLALHGYEVHGSDISSKSIEEARRRAERLGAKVEFSVADMTMLQPSASFDAVIAFDNAIAHMHDTEQLEQALASMRRAAAPGASLAVSLRDYEPMLRDRPTGTLPAVHEHAEGRSVYVQTWRWDGDLPAYESVVFLLLERDGEWLTRHATGSFRAWTTAEVVDAATNAGWNDARVIDPAESGYYQPIVLGSA